MELRRAWREGWNHSEEDSVPWVGWGCLATGVGGGWIGWRIGTGFDRYLDCLVGVLIGLLAFTVVYVLASGVVELRRLRKDADGYGYGDAYSESFPKDGDSAAYIDTKTGRLYLRDDED